MVRLKSRYVLFDILYPPTTAPLPNYSETATLLALHSTSQQGINLRSMADLVRKQVQLYFGDQGAGVVGMSLVVKYFSAKTSTGIIRCSRDHYQLVCAALSMINTIGGKEVIVRVVRVSGTIKKCEEAAVERNRQLMRLMDKKFDADDEKEIMNIVQDEEDMDDD